MQHPSDQQINSPLLEVLENHHRLFLPKTKRSINRVFHYSNTSCRFQVSPWLLQYLEDRGIHVPPGHPVDTHLINPLMTETILDLFWFYGYVAVIQQDSVFMTCTAESCTIMTTVWVQSQDLVFLCICCVFDFPQSPLNQLLSIIQILTLIQMIPSLYGRYVKLSLASPSKFFYVSNSDLFFSL